MMMMAYTLLHLLCVSLSAAEYLSRDREFLDFGPEFVSIFPEASNRTNGTNPSPPRHVITPEDISTALTTAYKDSSEPKGRLNLNSRLEKYKAKITDKIIKDLTNKHYLSASILARAISLDIDLISIANINNNSDNNNNNRSVTVIPVRGGQSSCQQSPPCLDLACGRCFDPLTTLHGDCGRLSYFKCSGLVSDACLPWTCAKSDSPSTPLLRNYLPRRARSCVKGGSGNSKLAFVTPGDVEVEMTGLGVVTNALTRCAEYPVCWDEGCEMCYDSLEQVHAPCPPHITVMRCDWLPEWCQPTECWGYGEERNGGMVLVRDQEPKPLGGVC